MPKIDIPLIPDTMACRLRRLSVVPRWVVVPTLRQQNVAEHSFHVAWMVVWIAEKLGIEVPLKILFMALLHDNDEAITGDIPSTSKELPDVRQADGLKALIKVADCLEASQFLHEEFEMGHTGTVPIQNDLLMKGEMWLHRVGEVYEIEDLMPFNHLAQEIAHICGADRHPNIEAREVKGTLEE